jgi:formamidopyrimidine-DNA glycosylase
VPELPEVENARRQIRRWAGRRKLDAIRVLDPGAVRRTLSSRPSDRLAGGPRRLEGMLGRTTSGVRRHGKRLAWIFGPDALLVHLGMTGFFTLRTSRGEEPPPLARVGFGFGTRTIWFVDGRRFGCVVPIGADEVDLALRSGQGPDAWDDAPGGDALHAALGDRRPLKVALMDQARLAGLGNIHTAEALFRAGLDPFRATGTLTAPEWERLAGAVREQLRIGTEDLAAEEEVQYVNLGGPNPFQVYGRADEPCPACGTPIASEEQAGRTTFWCPSCQDDGARPAR